MRQSIVPAGNRFGSRLGMLVAVSAAAIGVIYGYDTGIVAGALLFVPKQFHLSTAGTSSIATAVAIGMIAGALVTSRVADVIGRKRAMVAITVGYVVFAVLSGAANGLVFLDLARFFLGVTIGLSVVTAPVFIAESSSPRIRGSLVVSYQVATVSGIMSAYLVGYGLATVGAWRWMFALSAMPAAAVGLLLLRLPDTPRWYAMRGRWEEAASTLRRIDPDLDADAELADIRGALRAERGASVREMLHRPYLRATLFVVGLGFLVQITGINAIIYFTPLIFTQLGLTGDVSQLLVPGLIQAVALLATLVALRIVDRVGRRVVLLAGIGAMMAANALLIAVFAAGLHGGLSVLAFLGVLLFTCGFDFGFGALVWVYASESFPARLRTTGASAMLTADLVGNLLIAQFFLSVLGDIGGVWTFTMFLVLAAVSFGYVWWLAPETKGRPLESIRGYWENGGRWPDRAARDGADSGRHPGGQPTNGIPRWYSATSRPKSPDPRPPPRSRRSVMPAPGCGTASLDSFHPLAESPRWGIEQHVEAFDNFAVGTAGMGLPNRRTTRSKRWSPSPAPSQSTTPVMPPSAARMLPG